jgi:RHS repeat-associated protein
MTREGQTYFYHADGLGSIRQLSDSTGTSVQSYTYNSFGQIVDQQDSITNPYTFTGREYDPETGLYYYRARYYDPRIGQFLQEDPVAGWLVEPQSLNLHSYVFNNPIDLVDLWGLMGCKPIPRKSTEDKMPSVAEELAKTVATRVIPSPAGECASASMLAPEATETGIILAVRRYNIEVASEGHPELMIDLKWAKKNPGAVYSKIINYYEAKKRCKSRKNPKPREPDE